LPSYSVPYWTGPPRLPKTWLQLATDGENWLELLLELVLEREEVWPLPL
jgi:hypothetical protein